jgi:hypothetical protein
MNRHPSSHQVPAHITIRVSGKLFQGHLSSLDQLVQSADECSLWPVLSLEQLEEVDRAALAYLMENEDRRFGIMSCPQLIRERMEDERERAAA